jgi:neutral ceramidase
MDSALPCRRFLLLCLAILVLPASWLGAADESPPPWRAGVASAVITPQTNLWLGGYAARVRPADGTTQELQAKVLALADAHGGRFVFVTLDAIGVTRALRKDVEARLRTSYQLQPHEFVINASHTHTGPEFRPARVPVDGRGSVEAAQAYERHLGETIQRLAGVALERQTPARVAYARARAGFAMNRRLPRPEAEPTNAPNPDGPVDHDVPVLRVDGPDGRLHAILFGYACHNTTLTQAFYQFCGDYAGYAQEFLQEDHPGTLALFMSGCGADQNPYPRGVLEHARIHGRSLASAVGAALAVRPRPLHGPIRSGYFELDLPFAPAPSRGELERRLGSKERNEVAHARRLLERLELEGRLPTHYPYPVQVLQLGDSLKMIMLGAEVVVDYAVRLKQQYGGPNSVWVAGYSNDIVGYIPSERVLREGGYEGATALRLANNPGPWAPGVEERIIAKIAELDRALTGGANQPR